MPRTFTDPANRRLIDPHMKAQEHLKGAFTGTRYDGVTYTLKGEQDANDDWRIFVTPAPEPGEEFFIGWVGRYNTGWSYKLEPDVQRFTGFARTGRPTEKGWAWLGRGQGKTRREATYLLFGAYSTALAAKLTAEQMADAARNDLTVAQDDTYLLNLADARAFRRPLAIAFTPASGRAGEYAVYPILDVVRDQDTFLVRHLVSPSTDVYEVATETIELIDGKATIRVMGTTEDEDAYPAGQRRKAKREAQAKRDAEQAERDRIARRKANAEAQADFIARVNDWMRHRMDERAAFILAAVMRSHNHGMNWDDWTVVAEQAKGWHETRDESSARWRKEGLLTS